MVGSKVYVFANTETVLRIFDENYADILPASTLPIMRLSILVHDIGKSEAAKRNDKVNQQRYNIEYAKEFMRLNNVDDSISNLIISMIGEGKELAGQYMLKHDSETQRKFYKFYW